MFYDLWMLTILKWKFISLRLLLIISLIIIIIQTHQSLWLFVAFFNLAYIFNYYCHIKSVKILNLVEL